MRNSLGQFNLILIYLSSKTYLVTSASGDSGPAAGVIDVIVGN